MKFGSVLNDQVFRKVEDKVSLPGDVFEAGVAGSYRKRELTLVFSLISINVVELKLC